MTSLRSHAYSLARAVGIDPLTVLVFLSALIPLVQVCLAEPDDIAKHFRQNTRATRAQSRRAAKIAWRDAHGDTPMPPKLMEEFVERMARVTNDEMRQVYRSKR